MFENDRQAAFFFGEPVKVVQRIWNWFVVDADIYRHLRVTLIETAARLRDRHRRSALVFGLWLALRPLAVGDLRPLHQGRSTRCRA